MSAQSKLVQEVEKRYSEIYSDQQEELNEELSQIVDSYPITAYSHKLQNKVDQLQESYKNQHEFGPLLIDNSLELKIKILKCALQFGIYGDIELDQGFSFAYQITIFFPTYFQT